MTQLPARGSSARARSDVSRTRSDLDTWARFLPAAWPPLLPSRSHSTRTLQLQSQTINTLADVAQLNPSHLTSPAAPPPTKRQRTGSPATRSTPNQPHNMSNVGLEDGPPTAEIITLTSVRP